MKKRTNKEILDEIRAAHAREFYLQDKKDDELREAMKEIRRFVDLMKEQGFTTQEALIYLGSMTRPQ